MANAIKIEDLKKYFFLDEIDIEEFFVILTGQSWTYNFIKNGKKTEVRFGEQEKHEFSITLDKHSKVIEAQLGAHANETKLKNVHEDIQKALSNKGIKIYRSVIFSKKPLKKSIVCTSFRLLAMPKDAPVLNQLDGMHPLIMEVSFNATENKNVNGHRAFKVTEEYVLLLNLLLNTDMYLLIGNYKYTSHWIITKGSSQSQYCQEGYIYDNFQRDLDDFSEVGEIENVQELDESKYYFWRYLAENLHPSPKLESYVRKYEQLSHVKKNHFKISLKWFFKTNYILRFSWSMAMMCLANAMQILAGKKKVKSKCSGCGRDNVEKSDNELFKEFLEKYAKGVSEKLKKDFYSDYRNKIAHGNLLRYDEIHGMAQTFDPQAFKDNTMFWEFKNIVQIAMINWLDES